MMLNADVRKGGVGFDQMRTPAGRGRGRNRGIFVDILYGRLDDPNRHTRKNVISIQLCCLLTTYPLYQG